MAKEVFQTTFSGIRNDLGPNFTSQEYLRIAENVSYDDITGANKILFPEKVLSTEYYAGSSVDGGYEYKYLDSNNQLQTKNIVFSGGDMFDRDLGGTALHTDVFTAGHLVRCTTQNDKCFMTNGVDYPKVFWGEKNIIYEMGSGAAEATTTAGEPTGGYKYQVSYVIGGVETIIGTTGNYLLVDHKQITVNIPLGPTGCTARKLYRTIAGGSTFFLLATVSDNTTLTYTDNVADGALGAAIGAINNEVPRPRFIESNSSILVGAVVDKYPTQAFTTETGLEWFDLTSFTDISNISNDNSPIVGMGQDYSQIFLGSERHIYLMDVSGTTVSTQQTRANIGVLDGYSIVRIPQNNNFPGGTMFLASDMTFRVFSGNTSLPVQGSLDNIRTDNWGQPVQGIIDGWTSKNKFDAVYYDFKYHIMVRGTTDILTFNTKTSGWAKLSLMTNDAEDEIDLNCFILSGDYLFVGRQNTSYVEKMYAATDYNGNEYTATLRTPALPTIRVADEDGSINHVVTNEFKYMTDLILYFVSSGHNKWQFSVYFDGDYTNPQTGEIELEGGFFDPQFYSPDIYDTGTSSEDFRVVRLNRFARWIEIELKSVSGVSYFRGYRLLIDDVKSKE